MAQFNKNAQDFLNQERTLFEVPMIANKNGEVVEEANRFPVDSVILTGIGTSAVSNSNPFPISDAGGSLTVDGHVGLDTGTNSIGTVGINSGTNKIGSVTINTGAGNSAVSINNPLAVQVGFQTFRSVNTTPVTDYNPLPVYLSDIEHTSKNRLKVSPFETTFFNTFQYGIETDVWDTRVSLGGSATHDPTRNNVIMSVGLTTGSQVIRQTRNVLRYVPGRQSQATFAVIFTPPTTGIRRRIGVFEENDGFFFEDDGSGDNGYYCVIRSSTSGITTDIRVPRNQWNGDRLDGTGISSITASASAQQLVTFDYEWYGAGQVKVGFSINGKTHTIHTFNHANLLNLPWCRTPFLPIRVELTNVVGVATTSHIMYQGSNSVLSEGTPDKLGIAQNIESPITGYTIATAQTYYPLVSIRLKSTALKGIVLPTFFQAATLYSTGGGSNAVVVSLGYKLIRNATLTGGTWVDMQDSNAFTQYNRTATGIGTNGVDLDSGFIVGGGGGTGVRLDKDTVYQLGRSGIGTISDTLTLAVAVLDPGVTNAIAYGAMTWIEQR
jgi:hypothetical protein